jgi:hypothetical protein
MPFGYNGLVPIAWKQDPESFLEYMFKVSLDVTCIVFYNLIGLLRQSLEHAGLVKLEGGTGGSRKI